VRGFEDGFFQTLYSKVAISSGRVRSGLTRSRRQGVAEKGDTVSDIPTDARENLPRMRPHGGYSNSRRVDPQAQIVGPAALRRGRIAIDNCAFRNSPQCINAWVNGHLR